MLIARVWHGITREKSADEYLRYIEESDVNNSRKAPGNVGTLVLRRIANGAAEFFVISIWESYEAICRFTGVKDVNAAIYREEDYKHLCFPEKHVVHFEVKVGESQLFPAVNTATAHTPEIGNEREEASE